MSTAILSNDLLVSLRLPLASTAAYVSLYYGWMIGMLVCRKLWIDEEVKKKWREAQKDSKARMTLVEFRKALADHPFKFILDRSQLNQLEQMPPFLIALWLHALFIDPTRAAQLGFFYTALRVLYPVLYQRFTLLQIVVTYPNYAIISYLFFTVLLRSFELY